MRWIKFKNQNPPEGMIVKVKFGNEKIIDGKLEGNFMVYNPKDLDFKTMMSKAIEWSTISVLKKL